MEFWVFFTICCLACATICVLERLHNGGRRVSLRPPINNKYLTCIEKFRKSIDELSSDFGSMKISREQCKLLCKECLSLVQPTPPHSILKVSFCVTRRALELIQDCRSEYWILKAVEFGNCKRHFLEILLDLQPLGVMAEFDISEETKSKIEELNRAWELDTAALRNKLESESRHDYPDRCLADQLKANPSSTEFKAAPDEIGKHVTEFDFLTSKVIYNGGDDICVFPITFCDKKLAIKMRLSKLGAEVQEDKKLQNEAFFMKKCRHPYAVALMGSWEAKRTDCPRVPLLLMEFMDCDLKCIIERNRERITERNKRRWWPWGGTEGFPALDAIHLVLPVAKVMKYLHEIGVVHLDLKPQNILYTEVPETQDHPEVVSVKLADFGEAQMVIDGVKGKVGTRGYMDPDMHMWRIGKGSVDLKKADVFSFGMVFGEVLTGVSLMEALGCKNLHPDKFYEKLKNVKQVPLPRATPKFVKSIVERCLKRKSDERPSFEVICEELQKAEIQLLKGWTWKCLSTC